MTVMFHFNCVGHHISIFKYDEDKFDVCLDYCSENPDKEFFIKIGSEKIDSFPLSKVMTMFCECDSDYLEHPVLMELNCPDGQYILDEIYNEAIEENN